MAGQPNKRAMVAELTRRCLEELGDGNLHLEFMVQWVESGRTITELAKEFSANLGTDISPASITRYLRLTYEDSASRMAQARAQGAHGMVDRALEILDDAPTYDREQLTKAKMRADGRLWVAERWNKHELGRAPETVVNVNNNTLHLDSMRKRAITSERERAALPLARAFLVPSSSTEGEVTIDSAIDVRIPDAIMLPDQQLDLLSSGL